MTTPQFDGLKAIAEKEAATIAEGTAKYADDPIKSQAFKFLCLANEHISKAERIEAIKALAKEILA